MSRLLILATAVTAATGCVRLLDLPPGLPADGRVVRDVEIAKNKHVKDEDIEVGLETHPPEGIVRIKYNVYDPDAVASDRARIESFYQRQGYFDAEVTGVRKIPVRDRYVDVIFEVDEGKPTTIRSIGISGLAQHGQDMERRAFDALKLIPTERFRETSYTEAKTNLARFLANEGFAFAELRGKVLVEKKARAAVVRFSVITGPRVKLMEPSVAGLKYYPTGPVARRIAWRAGEQYHPDLLKKTRLKIRALDRFSNVSIDLSNRSGDQVIPDLILREAKRNEIRLGGGFAIDPAQWSVRGRGGYVRRGFLGALNTLTIDLRPAYAFQPPGTEQKPDAAVVEGFVGEALAAVERVDFPAVFFTSRVQVGFEVDQIEAFSTLGPRLGLSTTRRLFNERVSATVGWGFRLDAIRGIRVLDPVAAGIPDSQRVGFFEQRIVGDFRDQVLQPTRGLFLRLELEEGAPYFGGEGSYIRIAPESRGYLNVLPGRLVLAARVAAGTELLGDQLPVTRRYLSGGASRHRGFPQRTLSPTALTTANDGTVVAIGGSAMLESNFEARVHVYDRYGLVAFADGGDVVERLRDIAIAELHWAAGLGVRIQTPVGPVRVDLGFRLNRLGDGNPRPGDRFAFHLSLGEAF